MRVFAAIAVSVVAGACLDAPGTTCQDGTLCPDGTSCATIAGATRCVSEAQRELCANAPDETECTLEDGTAGLCNTGVCLRAGCGDGFVKGAEQCDGTDLGRNDVAGNGSEPDGVIDCRDLGYYTPGVLECRDDCTFERNGCNNAGRCGDGLINGDEQCDGTDYGGADCTQAGYYEGAGIACNTACRLDFGSCGSRCGDNLLDPNEECDGALLGAATDCTSLGFYRPGMLRCLPNCAYDRLACNSAGYCGDGVVENGEECDAAALSVIDANNDQIVDCRDVEAVPGKRYHDAAPLGCLANCQLDTSSCSAYCGDGITNGPEACDASDVGDTSCAPYGGTVQCDPTCSQIVASCEQCGDGVKNGPEVCDGADVGGLTCLELEPRRYTGSVGCASDCSQTTIGTCSGTFGDGLLNGGELCDPCDTCGPPQPGQPECCSTGGDVFAGNLSCTAYGFYDDPDEVAGLACAGEQTVDATACASNGYCGDGVLDPQEACDGLARDGLTCGIVNGRGALDCDAGCQLAYSTCEESVWGRYAPLELMPFPIYVDVWSQNEASAWVLENQSLQQWDGQRFRVRWRRDIDLPAMGEPTALWGFGDTVWVADRSDGVYRWVWNGGVAGGALQLEPGSPSQVHDLWGRDGVVYAASDLGVFERDLDGTWTQVAAGQYVSVDGRDDVVMAAGAPGGNGHNVARKVDGTWTTLEVSMRDAPGAWIDLAQVSVLSRDFAVFVLASGTDQILVWDGLQGWTVPVARGGSGSQTFIQGVYAAQEDEIWVLAERFTPTRRYVLLRWSGYAVSGPLEVEEAPVSLGVPVGQTKLVGFGDGNVWAIGSSLAQYEGTGWRVPAMNELRVTPSATPIFVNPSDLAALEVRGIASVRGSTWLHTRCTSGNCGQLAPIELIEHRLVETSLPTQTPRAYNARDLVGDPTTFDAMTIAPDGWVWGAFDDSIRAVARAGQPDADPMGLPQLPMMFPERATAAATIGGDVMFALGGAPARLARYDGAMWVPMLDIIDPLTAAYVGEVRAIAGVSDADIWVAGHRTINGDPVLGRYRGGVWTVVPFEETGGWSSGPIQELTGLWVAAGDEGWVVANDTMGNGYVYRIVWSDAAAAPEVERIRVTDEVDGSIARLYGVWGSSGRDVWFVGDASEALHFDGMSLTRLVLPRGGLRHIAGSGPDDVWAAGQGDSVIRLTHPLPAVAAGQCASAVPIYCAEAPGVQTVVTVAPGDTAYYRLASPISAGLARGQVHATVAPVASGLGPGPELLFHRARDARTSCDLGGFAPPRGLEMFENIQRGSWYYIGVFNPGSDTATFRLTLDCTLDPP